MRGGVRLAVDGLRRAIGDVEALHGRLAGVDPPVRGVRVAPPQRGWPAVVYRGMRGTTDLLGGGLDLALASLQASAQGAAPREADEAPSARRVAFLAALNGVAGDHLYRTDNPLAIPLALRQRSAPSRPRVLVLAHDLGLDDLQWTQRGHDHGHALGEALEATPLYVHYNSGRHVWATGQRATWGTSSSWARRCRARPGPKAAGRSPGQDWRRRHWWVRWRAWPAGAATAWATSRLGATWSWTSRPAGRTPSPPVRRGTPSRARSASGRTTAWCRWPARSRAAPMPAVHWLWPIPTAASSPAWTTSGDAAHSGLQGVQAMSYLPKAQEQMNGDLLVPETTKLFLHRVLRDLQAQAGGAGSEQAVALTALESALGPCLEPLPTVREMLDLPDPEVERRGRALLRVSLPR
ncbi:MAG: hypothetical protein EOO24_23880 [Comamonadaceae bacterium]|nr:MAG: hypothetical protein EOO24_23880 [Comamonadaceae bacterium]